MQSGLWHDGEPARIAAGYYTEEKRKRDLGPVNSRPDIPHLHTEDVELDPFVGQRLVPERLTRSTDAFFQARVYP
jgi:hypothetical protein